MVKNCAYQMHNALTERKTLNLLSEAEIRIGEGTTADVEPSRSKLAVDWMSGTAT